MLPSWAPRPSSFVNLGLRTPPATQPSSQEPSPTKSEFPRAVQKGTDEREIVNILASLQGSNRPPPVAGDTNRSPAISVVSPSDEDDASERELADILLGMGGTSSPIASSSSSSSSFSPAAHPKIPFAFFRPNGQILRLAASEGNAIHALPRTRQRIVSQGPHRCETLAYKAQLEREEREQTIDLRSERERTIDPDATEDEDGDEEDGRKKEVVDPDATEDEAEEGEEDAAAAAVPANENEQGTSRAQHGLIPAEIALLPVPLPRLQTRPLKLAPERPFDAVQIAEQRRLCIARGINPEEPHKLEAIYYARIAGEHSTWVEAKPAERAGSATQTYFEKRYTKIRPSDGTLADKQRWLAEMWALPKFATQEQKGGEKMMKVVDGMHAVVEKSCQMPICHGVVKEVRKGLRVRAPSPPWGVDLPEKAVGKKSCGKAKGKASPRKKAPLMLATPVVLQPVTLAAAGLCRKRSAATAAVKTVSPSPSKKPRLVIDPPCPEADPKHSGHADYMAHLDAKKEAKASVSPPVDAPIRGKRQTRKTVKVEAMEVEGASGGWDGSWSFH